MNNRKFVQALLGLRESKSPVPVKPAVPTSKNGWCAVVEASALKDGSLREGAGNHAMFSPAVIREARRLNESAGKATQKPKKRRVSESRRLTESCTLSTRHACSCRRCLGH